MPRNESDYSPVEFKPAIDVSQEIMPRDEVDICWNEWHEASQYDRQFKKDWSRFYTIYARGGTYSARAPWQSDPVVPLAWSAIQTVVPILTDSRPQITVVPRTPETQRIASVLGLLVGWNWEQNDLDIKLPKTMVNAMIFGNGFLKVVWDQAARRGMGDIRVFEVDPMNVFISPYARTLEEADYVIHAENLPRRMVERMYPGLIDPTNRGIEEPALSVERTITSQHQSAVGGVNAPFMQLTDGSGVGRVGSGGGSSDSGGDRVTVLERWKRTPEGMKQTVVVNRQLIMDRISPFEHDRFPFVHFVDHPHSWTLWAMGEIQPIEKLQDSINKRRGHIMDILNYTANPILIVDPALIDDFDSLEARPNLVIPAEGGPAAAGWLTPPSVPSALFEVTTLDKVDLDAILGNVDVQKGARPPGVEAGVAIELLQEAANVRMRQKSRHMENSLRKLGELFVAMIQQFYTTERVFKIAGREIMALEKPITQDGGFLFVNRPTEGEMGPQGPEMQMQNEIPPMSEAEFDVQVKPGSTLPVSPAQEFNKALVMYQNQIADDEYVWKTSQAARWEEEAARSRMFWGMKMQQQLLMEQAKSAAAPQEEENYQMSDDETNAALAEGASSEMEDDDNG